jgi:hypothetical protein
MTQLYSFTHCRHLTRESVCREAASFKRASGKYEPRSPEAAERLFPFALLLVSDDAA